MPRKNDDRAIRYTPETLIKQAALDVGFSDAGIASLVPSPQSDTVFDEWIANDRNGDMRYLSGGADKRHDPALLLGGGRSVVCVALNYYSEQAHDDNRARAAAGDGCFSLYVRGRDYHSLMTEMLTELEQRLRALFPHMRSRVCVDTQPISERDFAIRAGIAWLGKNTMVISPEFGSWIFLGELITDLVLAPDDPVTSLCGSCSLCMDACPTGAIDDDYRLDARRCISYLTIEKRGEIAHDQRAGIGDHLFGCDICQDVCPFNNYAKDASLFVEGTSPVVQMSLQALREISDGEFRDLTRDSAISRCKADGLRRNAGIVAENLSNRK